MRGLRRCIGLVGSDCRNISVEIRLVGCWEVDINFLMSLCERDHSRNYAYVLVCLPQRCIGLCIAG
jgi:hypothetical protein